MKELKRGYNHLKKRRKELKTKITKTLQNPRRFFADKKTKDLLETLGKERFLNQQERMDITEYFDSYKKQGKPALEKLKKMTPNKVLKSMTFKTIEQEKSAYINPERFKDRLIRNYNILLMHAEKLQQQKNELLQIEDQLKKMKPEIHQEKIRDKKQKERLILQKHIEELRQHRKHVEGLEKQEIKHSKKINNLIKEEKNLLNWITKERLEKANELARIAETMREHRVTHYYKPISDIKPIEIKINHEKVKTISTKHFDIMQNSINYALESIKGKKHKEQKDAFQSFIDSIEATSLVANDLTHPKKSEKHREIVNKIERMPKLIKELKERRKELSTTIKNLRIAKQHLKELRKKKP